MEIVAPSHPALRAVAVEVTDIATQVSPHLDAMRELMHEKNGIGLAAPQVGIGLRFFVTRIAGLGVVINPRITAEFGHRVSRSEGCLTWPGRTTFVARRIGVSVAYTDRDGIEQTSRLGDMAARVFQHELDHLNGICIFK